MFKPAIRLAVASAVAVAAFPMTAYAQSGASVGERLVDILRDTWGPLFLLITFASFVLGLALLARGLMLLKDASNDGGRGVISGGLKHIFAAVLLMSLPEAAGVGVTTLAGSDSSIFGSRSDMAAISESLDLDGGSANADGLASSILGKAGTPRAPENCYNSSDPVVCMAQNIASNAVPIGIMAIFALVFLGGLWTFASTILEVARSHGNSNRLPQGWGTRLVASFFMMNSPWLFYTVSNTILGVSDSVITSDGFQASSSFLSYSYAGGGGDIFEKYSALLSQCLIILSFFGVWSFVRGLLTIKATAEGKSQGTYMNGAVYMVAGVLLANAKASTCAILYTIGGSGMTFGFCS